MVGGDPVVVHYISQQAAEKHLDETTAGDQRQQREDAIFLDPDTPDRNGYDAGESVYP